MSISEDFLKLTPAKESPKLSISMTTTPVLFCFLFFFVFYFSAWNVFPSLQTLQCDAEQVSKKNSLTSDLRMIAANKGFFVSDTKHPGTVYSMHYQNN